jgi:DNA-nicking Smr family endonuclease
MKRIKNYISLAGQGGFEPFKDLDRLMVKNRLPKNEKPVGHLAVPQSPVAPELSESEMFSAAMTGVTPLHQSGIHNPTISSKSVDPLPNPTDEFEKALAALVDHGIGFRVSRTPEYIQGSGLPVEPTLIKKLHQGKFAIEAHIDLHGLFAEEAAEELDRFIDGSIKSGKRSLLIVHGRGLSSPGKPVLKALVERTLTQGPYRRWLLAYTSARQCDGGAGATQVLLRQRPLTNRQLKQLKLASHDPVDMPVL